MLGLLSTKTNRLEAKDDLLRRIEEASKFIPIDQLAIGPQCGFQSAANRDGVAMTIDEQRRKMELIVEVAREVWGSTQATPGRRWHRRSTQSLHPGFAP